MTLMLASVTGLAEAEIALKHGADIIDLKDPAKEALGALEPAIVRSVVADVGARKPVSAVIGSLWMQPEEVRAAAQEMAGIGPDYIKVGLPPGPAREDCVRGLASLAGRSKLVGVLFADLEADHSLVPLLAASGFSGVMLDTARKGRGRLLDHRDIVSLRGFVDACRAHGMMSGLAGSLEAPDVPRLLLIAPDLLGFRGALCARHDRTTEIDPEAVRVIRELIPLDSRSTPRESVSRVDYRLLAARGYSVDPDKKDVETDQVIVRDFVLPVRLGAYDREREKPQNVCFNVNVRVRRPGHTAEDIRDVFSYDVITDGIRIITAGHISLVEALAERVAAFVLAHPRAVSVTVRIEKLDVGPGAVGVEIVRERLADVARIHHLFPAVAGQMNTKAAE